MWKVQIILSDMESNPTPDEASASIAEARAAAVRLARELQLPSHFHSSVGVAIAIQIGTSAAGIAAQDGWPVGLLGAGLVVFAAVAVVQLVRFRRLNGAWVWAVANQVVLGSGTAATLTYLLAFSGALLAAFGGLWWLVAVVAVAGGGGYVRCGQLWLSRYRKDPVSRPHGEGTVVFVLAALVAATGLVLLVAGH
jgi:hypothetical protein